MASDDGGIHAFEAIFAKYPRAMTPVVAWGKPNEDIDVYRGPIEVRIDGTWIEGSGTAQLRWVPSPRLAVRVEFSPMDADSAYRTVAHLELDEAEFRVDGFTGTARRSSRDSGGLVDRTPPDATTVRPYLQLDVTSFERLLAPIQYLRFDVLNLEAIHGTPIATTGSMGNRRLSLTGAGWSVTLDGQIGALEQESAAKDTRGYLVTHTGMARKEDDSEISPAEAQSFLTMLQYSLSIPQSRWVTPIVPRGFAGDDELAWESWQLWNTGPWSQPLTWIPDLFTLESQANFFERLAKRWYEGPQTEQLLRTATHYYLDSQRGGLLNRSLIMAFALLELVGWDLLVDSSRGVVTARKYDGANLDERLRRLLDACSIPTQVPSETEALRRLATEKVWEDGPKAVSEVRHTAVHARRHKDGWKWPVDVWMDAAHLADWYADLAMLALVGYDGRYVNRITAKSGADWEWVPWRKPSEPPAH